MAWVVAGLMLLGIAATLPWPVTLDAERGRVIDSQTGVPIAGANVAAVWLLTKGSFGGRTEAGPLELVETVTGSDGSYAFPATRHWQSILGGYPDKKRIPRVYVFKANYEPGIESGPPKTPADERLIALKSLGDSAMPYQAKVLESFIGALTIPLTHPDNTPKCHLKRIDTMIAALKRAGEPLGLANFGC